MNVIILSQLLSFPRGLPGGEWRGQYPVTGEAAFRDNIAAGLSPFTPESVAMEAGRLMLQRIDQLMQERANFAFETTLAAKSYVSLIREASTAGYEITLLYFWLSSPRVAKERVAKRVSMGGHYYAGLKNLIKLYIPICDNWMVINNLGSEPELIANGTIKGEKTVFNSDIWGIILRQSGHD